MLLGTLLLESIALVGGTVHPLTPGSAPAPATILIEDGRIVAVGPDLELPDGARRVDASGLHLVPGLIDGLAYHDPQHDALYTAAGVTLVRDHGNDLARILRSRAPAARDEAAGPWLSICGAVLDGYPPSSSAALVLRDEHEAHAFVPTLIAEGVDFLGIHLQLAPAAWREVLGLAHPPDEGRRLQVWGPKPKEVALDELLAAGQDGLLFLDALLPADASWETVEPGALDAVVAQVASAGLRLTPLLRATARLADPLEDAPQRLELLGAQYAALWQQDLEVRGRLGEEYGRRARRVLESQRALVARLDAAGVELVPGSGAPHPWLVPGRGLVDELVEWQAAGIAPARCLELATAGAARALELEGRGTLEAGQVADVLLLRADPGSDIAALRELEAVVLRGRLLERDELEQGVESVRARARSERAAAGQPIDVPAPSLPDGTTLLRGYAETSAAGGRIAGERWAIVRAPNGDVSFCGRRRLAGATGQDTGEIEVRQTLRKDRLESFALTLRSGGHEMSVRGEVVAGQMRVERRLDGGFVDTKAAREQVATIDASSVTTLMLIARSRQPGPLPVLRFDEGLELEVVRWELALDQDGGHLLRTPSGRKFAAFRPDGALKLAAEWQGSALTQVASLEIDALDGPGLPLPEDKRQRVLAAEAAAAAAEATSPVPAPGPPQGGSTGAGGGGG